jgi:hypothetical protein
MVLRQLLRKSFHHPLPIPHSPRTTLLRFRPLRHSSNVPKPPPPLTAETHSSSRIDRILNTFPSFLHPYTSSLRSAPASSITAFLILHEITAIVPLVGLASLFHYSGWTPSFLAEGSYVAEGVKKFGRYFERKGWFGFSSTNPQSDPDNKRGDGKIGVEEVEQKWHVGEKGSRILIEVATAYAITKVLLPVRVIASVWATPWFARVVLRGGVGKLFGVGGKKITQKGSAAAESGIKNASKRP